MNFIVHQELCCHSSILSCIKKFIVHEELASFIVFWVKNFVLHYLFVMCGLKVKDTIATCLCVVIFFNAQLHFIQYFA